MKINRRREALAAARKAAGYTQESLAEALHLGDRSSVIRWESGAHAPLPYIRPKLARLLGRTQQQLEMLIDGPIIDEVELSSGCIAACDWLDHQSGWQSGTTYKRLLSKMGGSLSSKLQAQENRRGTVGRHAIGDTLARYYKGEAPEYWARFGDVETRILVATQPEWLEVDFPLNSENDLFSYVPNSSGPPINVDNVTAVHALRRLHEVAVLNVAMVNSPLYRLIDLNVSPNRIEASVDIVPFVQYALTTDVLETELVDGVIAGDLFNSKKSALSMRERYLPDMSSVFDISNRSCSGGVLSLCAMARPADRHRGPADYLLFGQERGQQVLNGAGRLSVIPRGFHQPLTDYRRDAPIGSTLRRELEEELFRRVDVDSTISEQRVADPMHPNRLSEPMRWLMQSPDRVRFEATGFGFDLVNGNFEYSCITIIEDPEFWVRYGDRIEANWESAGLRQFSSLDQSGLLDLVQDEAWSNEGLFAFMQGLQRLFRIGGRLVGKTNITTGVTL